MDAVAGLITEGLRFHESRDLGFSLLYSGR